MAISSRLLRAGVLSIVVLALGASGCSGSDDGRTSNVEELSRRLQAAEKQLADADALDIELRTDQLPDDTTGLGLAKGRGYQGETADEAAFAGKIDVLMGGSTISADVIAADGKVWARTKIAPEYYSIKPEQFGAADPAALLGVKGEGLPTLLSQTEDLTEGDKSRDGRTVLTTIEGALPGKLISRFLPTADDSQAFDVSYRLDDDDMLQGATISGPFYAEGEDVSYELSIKASDDDSVIEPPRRGGGP